MWAHVRANGRLEQQKPSEHNGNQRGTESSHSFLKICPSSRRVPCFRGHLVTIDCHHIPARAAKACRPRPIPEFEAWARSQLSHALSYPHDVAAQLTYR